MRTLFLNPPSYDDFDGGAGSRYQATREVWSFWYPTWLCYPAGLIPGSRVLDAPPEHLNQEQTVRIACEYDFVVLHTSTPSFKLDVRTAEMIKQGNPRCTIAFVGGHVTAQPDQSLKASAAIDLVARKEFDFAMRDVAEGKDWAAIPGLSFRRNGAIVHNPEAVPMTREQLDALPFVTGIYHRDLDYLKYNSPYCQYPYVSLYTGRGCPARCTFCLWPQVTTGHSYRTRSPENVFEEMQEVQRLFPQMKEVFFDDDTFTADPPRARQLSEMFKPLGLCWSTNSRANVDRETLRVMKEGGLRLFVVGYESGNDQILKNIRKGVSIERARRFTKDCHDLGILIHGTFIVGLPGETLGTIEESIRFAREMNPETIQVSLASPYPGTHFYEYVKEHNFLVQDVYNDEAGYQKCTVSYPEVSSEQIFDAVERFYKKYYFRPKYFFKAAKKMVKSRDERKRMLREAGEFLSTMRKRRANGNGATAAAPSA
jgi:hopanoid biosynthesis associated radical SAM protein HpnJ